MTSPHHRGVRPPALVRLFLRLLLPKQDREFYLGDLEESGRRPWLREISGAVAFSLASGARRARAARRPVLGTAAGLLTGELRLGVRRLLKTPAATLTVMATLSVGIGLPALMFSLVDGALLTTLPFEGGERIVRVERVGLAPVTVEDYHDWSARQRSLEGLGAVEWRTVALTIEGEGSEPVSSAALDVAALRLLSVQPALGRAFTAADAAPGAPAVVLIGHALWRDRLAADPGVLGRTVRVDGAPADIVGVMPEGFGFPWDQEVWTPLGVDPLRAGPGGGTVSVFGKLKDGVAAAMVAAELDALDAQRPGPATATSRAPVRVVTYTNMFGEPGMAAVLGALMLGVAVLVLLVACANAANVLLARTAARSRDVAIRAALGASRVRIATSFWVEVSLLAAIGAVGGALFALLGVRLIRDAMPRTGWPFWMDIRVDLPVLLFVAGTAMLAATLAGLLPALQASRADRQDLLADGPRGGSSRRLGRVMRRLIGVELTVSFVLLVTAGLFIRSAVNFHALDLAFAPEEVHTARVRLPDARYRDASDRAAYIDRLLSALTGIRGAAAAAVATALPGTGEAFEARVAVEGLQEPTAPDLPRARSIAVTAGYFEAFRAPVVAGRAFDSGDREGSLPVAIVNTAFERSHLPGGAVGRRVGFPSAEGDVDWLTIVGVAPDLLAGGLDPGALDEAVYRPLVQDRSRSFLLAVRPIDPSVSPVAAMRRAVTGLDADVALFGMRPLDEVIDAANAQYAWLSALFLVSGALALFLAAVGLYGVMAFWVARRTREIGVRMALGGRARTIVGLVLRQGLAQVATGLAAGVSLAVPVGWLFRGALFGVPPFDPVVLGTVLAVLLVAGWLGCWIPALRATRVDPLRALAAD